MWINYYILTLEEYLSFIRDNRNKYNFNDIWNALLKNKKKEKRNKKCFHW